MPRPDAQQSADDVSGQCGGLGGEVDSGFEQFNPILTLELDGLQAEPGSMVLLGTALAACGVRACRRLAH